MSTFDWFKKRHTDIFGTLEPGDRYAEDGTVINTSRITNEGREAWMVRGYNAERKEYMMISSWFDPGLPRWIKDVKVPLVEGKGIPTILYFDLRAMKQFGIQPGSLKKIIICRVHDWDTVFHLHWLSQKRPDAKMGDFIKHTRLFKSRENVIIQSSHIITGVEVDPGGATFNHPAHLPALEKEEMGQLIKKYEVDPAGMVFWDFNIHIHLAPRH